MTGWWGEVRLGEDMSRKDKGLMDMDNSVTIAGGGYKETKW